MGGADTYSDENTPGIVEWIAERLSEPQRKALLGFPDHKWWMSAEIGATGSTLRSLNDFGRNVRGILPPLIVVRDDYSVPDRAYLWQLTDLGLRVVGYLTTPEHA